MKIYADQTHTPKTSKLSTTHVQRLANKILSAAKVIAERERPSANCIILDANLLLTENDTVNVNQFALKYPETVCGWHRNDQKEIPYFSAMETSESVKSKINDGHKVIVSIKLIAALFNDNNNDEFKNEINKLACKKTTSLLQSL